MDLRFQLLRSQSGVANAIKPTLRTFGRGGNHVLAVVTGRLLTFAMVSQCDVAIRTFHHMSAVGTLNVGREAASIQQQDHLPAVAQRLAASPDTAVD